MLSLLCRICEGKTTFPENRKRIITEGLTEIKVACLPAVLKAVGDAGKDVQASVQLTGSIVTSLN